MHNLKDIVKRGREGPALMFRSHTYDLEYPDDLLADIMALANADIVGQRALVIGVLPGEPAQRKTPGIPREEAHDSRALQALADEFIEPSLSIQVFTPGSGPRAVSVIVVDQAHTPPYLLKKSCGALMKGVGFIRRGKENSMLTRNECQVLRERAAESDDAQSSEAPNADATPIASGHAIALNFAGGSRTLSLGINDDSDLPSAIAARKLKAAIAARSEVEAMSGLDTGMVRLMHVRAFGQDEPFAKKSIDELKDDLRKVHQTFEVEDKFHMFEKAAHRLNFEVSNAGDRALKNAHLVLRLPREHGFEVAPKILAAEIDPQSRKRVLTEIDNPGYPAVTRSDSVLEVAYPLGEIRKHRSMPVFREPLRVVVTQAAADKAIPISYELQSASLNEPVTGSLLLQLAPAAGD